MCFAVWDLVLRSKVLLTYPRCAQQISLGTIDCDMLQANILLVIFVFLGGQNKSSPSDRSSLYDVGDDV